MDISNEAPKSLIILLVVLLLGLGLGYWYGSSTGFDAGYKKAEADVKQLQEAAAKKAAEEAAKVANPFQGVNPLQGIEANPFQKAKKVLNPFQ